MKEEEEEGRGGVGGSIEVLFTVFTLYGRLGLHCQVSTLRHASLNLCREGEEGGGEGGGGRGEGRREEGGGEGVGGGGGGGGGGRATHLVNISNNEKLGLIVWNIVDVVRFDN